jgi:hypothetical protein
MRYSCRIALVYVAWILVHFLSAQFYPKLCAPMSGYGFLITPLLTPTPHCSAMRWMIYQGGVNIGQLWFLFASIGMDMLSMPRA